MRFSHDKVSHYLRLVNDTNELHSTIVPGQLVVDCVLAYFQIEWTQIHVKYKKTIDIDEEVTLKKVSHNEISVFGLNGEEKIVITKKSNHTDL
ncbi:hypothetical protein BUZ55_07160 [Staphylococcus hominis]|uniref:hypothetical protein n=1 Tax=Staphylococcus hominis TaxID=1290 RepID=UPI000E69106B|nr:hypothetical protein [Staphylococcus hominis]RIO48894.1 hypothetical protein BUZ55_07160 [Staphylococcus hominis]